MIRIILKYLLGRLLNGHHRISCGSDVAHGDDDRESVPDGEAEGQGSGGIIIIIVIIIIISSSRSSIIISSSSSSRFSS